MQDRPQSTDQEARREAARVMGQSRSPAKVEAARKNGRLGGGRKKIYLQCPVARYHRFRDGRCKYCGVPKLKLKA